MKLSELEDLTYFGDSDSDSSSDSDSDSGTDTDEDDCIEESSSSDDNSSDSDHAPTEVVWAKTTRGVWEWPMSLMRSCILKETTCEAISFPRI